MLYILVIRMHIYIQYTCGICEIFIENPTQRYSLALPVPGCKDPQGTANIQTAQLAFTAAVGLRSPQAERICVLA